MLFNENIYSPQQNKNKVGKTNYRGSKGEFLRLRKLCWDICAHSWRVGDWQWRVQHDWNWNDSSTVHTHTKRFSMKKLKERKGKRIGNKNIDTKSWKHWYTKVKNNSPFTCLLLPIRSRTHDKDQSQGTWDCVWPKIGSLNVTSFRYSVFIEENQ